MKIGVLAQEEYINNGLQTFEANLVPWLMQYEEFEPIYYQVEDSYPYSRTLQTFKLRKKLRAEASKFDKIFLPAQNRLRFDPENIDAEIVPYVHDVVPYTSSYRTGKRRFLRPFLDAVKNKLDMEYDRHLSSVETALCASQVTKSDLKYRTGFQGNSEVVYQGVDDMPEAGSVGEKDIDAVYVGDTRLERKNPEMVENALKLLQDKGFTVASVNYNETGLPGESFVDVSDEKLAEIYSRSRFILHFSKMEGFGRTPVEAQRYGCIPLALDNRINREVLGRPQYSWLPVKSIFDVLAHVRHGVGQGYRNNARDNSSRFAWDRTRRQVKNILLEEKISERAAAQDEVESFSGS